MNTPKTKITIEASVNTSIGTAWACYTEPQHIVKWNFASDDWTCPTAINDLKPGGKMNWRMEAKDGSMGFDFTGTYSKVLQNKEIHLILDDNRAVEILFLPEQIQIKVRITFEAEQMNPVEIQRDGWQAILNNYKKHTENKNSIF